MKVIITGYPGEGKSTLTEIIRMATKDAKKDRKFETLIEIGGLTVIEITNIRG